jgi:hypothetical protein
MEDFIERPPLIFELTYAHGRRAGTLEKSNSKRGPRNFLPFGFKRTIIAPKACQLVLKYEEIWDKRKP